MSRILSDEEKDNIIVEFMESQERDLYCLELNEERYAKMLKTLPPGKWKDRITQLHAETVERKTEVESIIAATAGQLPTAERIAAAKARLHKAPAPGA